jgi:hypothetical protein
MKNLSSLITLVMLSLFVASCGSGTSNVLNGIKVQTTTVDDDVWMSFAADINLGAMSFASISVPIVHPRGQTPIGQLELVSGIAGVNQLKVSVNLSEVSDVQAMQARLPNGNLLPIIANNSAIAIDIGRGAKVYLTLSDTVTALGVAVPISSFDNLGQSLPGLNFFPIVSQGNIVATAGIFTGKPGQNGIAVVADLSRVVNMGQLMPTVASAYDIQAEEADAPAIKLDYRSHSGSKSQKAQLDQMLYEMNKRKTVLRMRK